MYLRVWWGNEKKNLSGILLAPGGSETDGLCIKQSDGNVVWISSGDITRSEWTTDPTSGVTTSPPRSK